MFIGVNYSFNWLPDKLLARLARYLAFKNVLSNNQCVSISKKRVVDVTFDPERGNFPVTRGIESWVISTLSTEITDFPTLSLNSLRTADVSPRSSPLRDDRNSILMTQNLPGIRSEGLIGGRIVVLATGFII